MAVLPFFKANLYISNDKYLLNYQRKRHRKCLESGKIFSEKEIVNNLPLILLGDLGYEAFCFKFRVLGIQPMLEVEAKISIVQKIAKICPP